MAKPKCVEIQSRFSSTKEHEWRLKNQLHHPHKPAYVFWDPTGKVYCQEWYLRGRFHRYHGGPAAQARLLDNTEISIWARKGLIHRTDGAAMIINGVETFWYQGACLPQLEWMMYADKLAPFPEDLVGRDQPVRFRQGKIRGFWLSNYERIKHLHG